jgi:SNF2 family DNA or RNA helicase
VPPGTEVGQVPTVTSIEPDSVEARLSDEDDGRAGVARPRPLPSAGGAAGSATPAAQGHLHPFQASGVRFLVERKRSLLADDVGLGKTVQIAAAIGQLWECELSRSPGIAVLYVTTAALVEQTTAELRQRLPSLSVTAVGGRANTGQPANVLVISHEFAHANPALIRSHEPYLVVVDEASALKGGGG